MYRNILPQTFFCLLLVCGQALSAENKARAPALSEKQLECNSAALNNFIREKAAILAGADGSKLLATPEDMIAIRRLEERYCGEVVRCTNMTNSGLAISAAFSKCLEEEARERYECEIKK